MNKEKLLKKRDNLLLKIANYGAIIEPQAFYSIPVLEQEIKTQERQLKILKKLR